MRKLALVASGAVAAMLLCAGAANAAAVFDVTVWIGTPNGVTSTETADAADQPTGPASATFTFTSTAANGGISWDNPNGQSDPNLVSSFIQNGTISGWSSPDGQYATEADFLDASLSSDGNTLASYFNIVGSYSGAGVSGTISHDDGASVYDYNGNAVYSSPGETTDIVGAFTLPDGSHNYTVDYVEANGAPSVLEFAATPGVPEPATWATMLVGLFGLGAVLRSRRQSVTTLAA
jgi:hypothetical protein